MSTEFGPCADWPVRFPCEIVCSSPEASGSAVRFATDVVWALSGRQFGTCEVTLRPCRNDCMDAPWPHAEWTWPGTSSSTSFS